jgi:hypothetical protein
MIEISFFFPLSTSSDTCNMAGVIVDVNAGLSSRPAPGSCVTILKLALNFLIK